MIWFFCMWFINRVTIGIVLAFTTVYTWITRFMLFGGSVLSDCYYGLAACGCDRTRLFNIVCSRANHVACRVVHRAKITVFLRTVHSCRTWSRILVFANTGGWLNRRGQFGYRIPSLVFWRTVHCSTSRTATDFRIKRAAVALECSRIRSHYRFNFSTILCFRVIGRFGNSCVSCRLNLLSGWLCCFRGHILGAWTWLRFDGIGDGIRRWSHQWG